MKIIGWVFLSILLIVGIIIGSWTYTYYTAEIRGKIGAREQIESKEHRLYSYEYFYDLYANYKSYEDTLEAQEENLKLTEDKSRRGRILQNIAAIKSQMARVREEYNANARKVKTKGKFKADDLPLKLSKYTP